MNNKVGFISTIRQPGQCINLTAEEIYSEIMKRGKLLKEKYSNKQKIEENEIENDIEEKSKEDTNNEDISNDNRK